VKNPKTQIVAQAMTRIDKMNIHQMGLSSPLNARDRISRVGPASISKMLTGNMNHPFWTLTSVSIFVDMTSDFMATPFISTTATTRSFRIHQPVG
jgi:hypothetical protein